MVGLVIHLVFVWDVLLMVCLGLMLPGMCANIVWVGLCLDVIFVCLFDRLVVTGLIVWVFCLIAFRLGLVGYCFGGFVCVIDC